MKKEEITNFFIQHVRRIRNFVSDHPSMTLIEFDIEDDNTGEYLASIFHRSIPVIGDK